VTRYRVRYLTEATEALRAAFLHVREDAGPRRAANWLRRVYASIDQLEIAPRATRDEGFFHGHEFRSKLVISHRVFFTISEDAQVVHVIDVVHTAQQTKLDEYTS
jgi:plasmid stabilization system protein ParE